MFDEDTTVAAAEATETASEPSPSDAVADETASAWADVKAEVSGEPSTSDATAQTSAHDDPDATAASAQAGEAADASGGGEAEEGTTEQEAAESATETAAEDVWANAPETLKSAHEADTARADTAEHARKSAEGRINALTRRIDAMIASGGEQSRTPPADRPSADDTPATETLAELEALEADYPEIAAPLKAVLMRTEARHKAEITRISQALQTVGEERLDARATAEEGTVVESHPDYNDIADSDDFVAWYNDQPQFVQAGIHAERRADSGREALYCGFSTTTSATGVSKHPADRTAPPPPPRKGNGERQQADPIRRAQLVLQPRRSAPVPGCHRMPEGGRRARDRSRGLGRIQA